VITLELCIPLRTISELFSSLLGDHTWAPHFLRNNFRAFSPLLGDHTWVQHPLRNDFRAFSHLLDDHTWTLHSLMNDFGAFRFCSKLDCNTVISWPLGWWYPAQGLIELIEYLYQQGVSSFSEAYLERTFKLSVLGLEQFGMGDRSGTFLGYAWVRTKCSQKTHVGLWGQYMILESCQE
jgi:hypothetical protein